MEYTFKTPDALFVKPVIIADISNDFVYGQEVNKDQFVDEKGSFLNKWQSQGLFGFVTSDVKTLSFFEKLVLIAKVQDYMQEMEQRRTPVYAGFYVNNDYFCIMMAYK